MASPTVTPDRSMHTVAVGDRRRSILAPAAFSSALMPSLQLVRSSRLVRRIAFWLLTLLIATTLLMAFAPWQQTVTGAGFVVAYAPRDRQQVLEATIEGRIVRWNEKLVENYRVTEGEFIAEIRDLDAEYATRLEGQLENTAVMLAASKRIVEATQGQLTAYRDVQQQITRAQDAYVEAAMEKVSAAEQKLSLADAAVPQLQAAHDRAKMLYEQNNIALEKYQEIERKLLESRAKVREETANVAAAKADLVGKQSDRLAYIQKAAADVSYYEGALDKALSEVAKMEKEQFEMQSKVARQSTQTITAPFNGFLVELSPNIGTQLVRKGDPICRIVPDTKDRAVQIWLNGNDAPLVNQGDHVRLQFEGWPAIQFAGWPSVAVGTFGGTVAAVDVIDNGKGKFRCQVRPDNPMEWPDERYLRQGVRANGWVLLEQVPLWFEFWRQLNGFPPALDEPSAASAMGGDKSVMGLDGSKAQGKSSDKKSSDK
jgi:hypothetical protein